MNCPKCNANIQPQAPFCTTCGEILSVSSGNQLPKWAPYLAGGIILFLLFLSLNVAGVLQIPGLSKASDEVALGGESGSPLVVLPGKNNSDAATQYGGAGSALDIQGSTPNPLAMQGENTDATSSFDGSTMPADIRAWLRHLKRVDEKRESLNRELAGKFMSAIMELRPGFVLDEEEMLQDLENRKGQASALIDEVQTLFSSLIRDFQSLPPPPACQRIADEYNSALLSTKDMTQEIFRGLQDADIGKLYSLLNTSYSRIDGKVENANQYIDQLCKRYNEPNVYRLFVESKSSSVDVSGLLKGLGVGG